MQVEFNRFKNEKLGWELFESLRFHDLLRPIAAGIDHNHGKPRAVDEIILPTEATTLLIATERVSQEDDIVIAVVVLEVGGDVEEVFLKRGLRRPPPKIVLSISSYARQIAIHWQEPRGDGPYRGQNNQEPETR